MPRIKVIIFDLDDTLFDCTGLLVANARKRAAKAMVAAGFQGTEDELYKQFVEIATKDPRADIFEELREQRIINNAVIRAGESAYNSDVVEDIHPFDDMHETLRNLKQQYKLALITTGVYKRQKKKIELLGLEQYFDIITVNDTERGFSLEDCFRGAVERLGVKPEEVVAVGDRIQSEIKVANRLGMISVRMLHGRFRDLKPKSPLETPDFEITTLRELPAVIAKADMKASLKVVAIGGGTGLPKVLEGMKKYTNNITAIVTVTDSGRSSGDIRKNLNILPPGDIRNCLVALSNSEELLRDVFQYRFSEGEYKGLSFGNLFIAALSKITGSFDRAIREASDILKLQGNVLPVTLKDTHLCAELEDGMIIEQEVNIIKPNKAPIKRLFLKYGEVKAFSDALRAIEDADVILIGPGCLFTSIIANMLVRGIPETIKKSHATKIYICNVATQPGQTDNYTASDHVKRIVEYLGEDVLDYVILNTGVPDKTVMESYEKRGSFLVENDSAVENMNIPIIKDNLLESVPSSSVWEKTDLLKHDPDKVARCILSTVQAVL